MELFFEINCNMPEHPMCSLKISLHNLKITHLRNTSCHGPEPIGVIQDAQGTHTGDDKAWKLSWMT